MEKRFIFVVTGRQRVNGVPRGVIETVVVCSEGDQGVRRFLMDVRPTFEVTTVTSLKVLEERAMKIRNTLLRKDSDWGVLIDPILTEKER